ncbi:Ankyrin repeat and KH domain-containing protein 1 [Homalodisca vitripennis]|nr:Ankyrin repeat and KH domain-containing protein 1 [Homalodisca vitripennis]
MVMFPPKKRKSALIQPLQSKQAGGRLDLSNYPCIQESRHLWLVTFPDLTHCGSLTSWARHAAAGPNGTSSGRKSNVHVGGFSLDNGPDVVIASPEPLYLDYDSDIIPATPKPCSRVIVPTSRILHDTMWCTIAVRAAADRKLILAHAPKQYDPQWILLEHGAGINTHSNEFKESALTLACYKGHLDMVRFLLEAGADQDKKLKTLHEASKQGASQGSNARQPEG